MQKITKSSEKKGLIITHVFKSEKSKQYVYTLSNGSTLEFQDKVFPTDKKNQNSNGQLNLIL